MQGLQEHFLSKDSVRLQTLMGKSRRFPCSGQCIRCTPTHEKLLSFLVQLMFGFSPRQPTCQMT